MDEEDSKGQIMSQRDTGDGEDGDPFAGDRHMDARLDNNSARRPIDDDAVATTTPLAGWCAGATVAPHYTVPCPRVDAAVGEKRLVVAL